MLFKYFSECHYINLDRRLDRRWQFEQQMVKFNIQAQRFKAIEPTNTIGYKRTLGKPGALGCVLSHLALYKYAQEKQLKSLLILEDDVVFHPDIVHVMPQIENFLTNTNWDMLFFHMSQRTKQEECYQLDLKYRICKSNGSRGTQCYAINHSAYQTLIQGMSANTSKHIDTWLMHTICRNIKTYSIAPVLASQRHDSMSDLTGIPTEKPWVLGTEWPDRY